MASLTRVIKIFLMLFIFLSHFKLSNANGGCIKIADDLLVQLTSAPIVPIVNKETSFLFSFGNDKGLINEQITGKISILKNQEKILEKDFSIKSGVLDLKHTFKNAGLYEIFLEFTIKNKIYKPEDFLIEVKEQQQNKALKFIYLFAGIIIGAMSMKFIKKRKQ